MYKVSPDIEAVVSESLDKLKQSDPSFDVLQYFHFEHLKGNLRDVSFQFANMALELATRLPKNPQRTIALNKLLEAKDASVRSALGRLDLMPPKEN